jgi:hypothetical protein
MTKILDLLPLSTSLHHAYIVIGEPKKVVSELNDFLEQRFGAGFTASANPDYCLREFSSWGIDESRELKVFQSRKSVAWSVKIAIIVPEIITLQAQNSLLKTLEEPTAGTHFFIVARNLGEYLPTVISRCQVLKLGASLFSDELTETATDWLSTDIARRFDLNKIVLKQQENNQNYVLNWLNCLLEIYWGRVSGLADKKMIVGAEALSKAIAYANQRGNSPRIILEHLAGVVPAI